jgi:hypothetical protein
MLTLHATSAGSATLVPRLVSTRNLPTRILDIASLVATTKTILEDIPKTKKAMTKDVRRGCNIVMDERF